MFHLYNNIFVVPENVIGYAVDKNTFSTKYDDSKNILEVIDDIKVKEGIILTGSATNFASVVCLFLKARMPNLTVETAYTLYTIILHSFKIRLTCMDETYGVQAKAIHDDAKVLSSVEFTNIYKNVPLKNIKHIQDKYSDRISFEWLFVKLIRSAITKFDNVSDENTIKLIELIKTKLLRIIEDYFFEFDIAAEKLMFIEALNNRTIKAKPSKSDYKAMYEWYTELGVIQHFTESSGVEGGYGILFNKVVTYIEELDKLKDSLDKEKLSKFILNLIDSKFIYTLLIENSMIQKLNPYLLFYILHIYEQDKDSLSEFI